MGAFQSVDEDALDKAACWLKKEDLVCKLVGNSPLFASLRTPLNGCLLMLNDFLPYIGHRCFQWCVCKYVV